jgi:hypothetical protein
MAAALAPIALVAGLAGSAVSAVGSYQSNMAASENAAYQAQVAANNAKIATTNANLTTESGETAVGTQELKNRATIGATKAGEAASGVDVNSGSFVAARAGEAEVGALDAATIRSNAARQAYGFKVQAQSDTAQSQLDTSESKQAASAAPLSAVGSLLSGISTVGRGFSGYQLQAGNSGAPSSGPLGLPGYVS